MVLFPLRSTPSPPTIVFFFFLFPKCQSSNYFFSFVSLILSFCFFTLFCFISKLVNTSDSRVILIHIYNKIKLSFTVQVLDQPHQSNIYVWRSVVLILAL